MDMHLINMLYQEVKVMRADLSGINPFDANKPGRLGSGISKFIEPYNDVLERAKAAVAEDPAAGQALRALSPAPMIKEIYVNGHVEAKSQLTAGLGRILAVLESLLIQKPAVPMRATREGVFFAGEYFEPLLLLTDLIKQAHTSIEIIDGYVGDGEVVLGLLAGKARGAGVRILTYSAQALLLPLAQAFLKQHGGLEIRTSKGFHDRFLILDSLDFYHFGASLKDMGGRGFMFSRIEEPEVLQRIRGKFEAEWSKAGMVKI
jgi:hypothetical protein